MIKTDQVQVFRSNTDEYHHAFQVFLDHTDQKIKAKERLDKIIQTVPSYVTTLDFDSAYTVAEFMLNLLPITDPISSEELKEYVKAHFAKNGGFRFSCHQDFLQICLRK